MAPRGDTGTLQICPRELMRSLQEAGEIAKNTPPHGTGPGQVMSAGEAGRQKAESKM